MFLRAFREALFNLRTNFFQTFLSVLGIVIGVGALVAMLSLIDGFQAWANARAAEWTSYENVYVSSSPNDTVDGIRTRRDTVISLDTALVSGLTAALPYPATSRLLLAGNHVGEWTDGERIGYRYLAATPERAGREPELLYGRNLTETDHREAAPVAIVNELLARTLSPDSLNAAAAVGTTFPFGDTLLTVVGVGPNDQASDLFAIGLPYATAERGLAGPLRPRLILSLQKLEDVGPAQTFTEAWLAARFPDFPDALRTESGIGRNEEVQEAFFLIRLVGIFIIGIAVVVGGIGVMNVLLMAVTERTREIGIRKAVGANRRDIMRQFLAESIATATLGSLLGLILGLVAAYSAAFVISSLLEFFEFNAGFSWLTLVIVAVVAILVGVIFGTYPARKASKLEAVTAINRD